VTTIALYTLAGIGLFVVGTLALFATPHLLRKILALNIMSSGVFLILVSIARKDSSAAQTAEIDPIPLALVLTGLVVAVSATAMALALICRYHAATGRVTLPEDSSS